jgi:hypothetical protein
MAAPATSRMSAAIGWRDDSIAVDSVLISILDLLRHPDRRSAIRLG